MKTLNKFFYALLALATVGMVACTEADTYEPGAPEIESCYDVYFPDAATLETQGPTGAVELDPADATEFTYTAYRNNTEGAVTVPVVVTANTQEKFTVSEIVFEEGSDVAEFTVSLNESEIGVPYTLSFAINDPQYVKQYESANANSISLTVTRVKWVDVGECAYTEDVITSWWGFSFEGEWAGQTHPTYNVKVQVRADSIDEAAFQAALDGTGSDAGLSGIYRLLNPYRVGPWADPEDTTLESDPTYLVINAKPYNRAYIDLQPLGISINGGEASIYSMVGYRLDNGATPTEDMYGSFNGGTLTFPVRALLGCPGGTYVGSNTYYANTSGAFALTVAPKLGKYSLVLPEGYEDGDFTFTEMELDENALFYSESQAAAWYPILEEGRPNVSTDDADRNFVAQYGLMYRLAECYAVDFPIYFGAKADGTVTVPAGFEEQATGLVQNGYDVYMAIDAKASKFNPETGELALVAEFYTYQGQYIIPYGVYNEVISTEAPDFPYVPAMDLRADFEYTALFTDVLKSGFQGDEWEATLEQGTCTGRGAAAFEKQYGTAYRIPSAYVNGYDIYFVANAEGKVSVPAGYELQPSGTSIYGVDAYLKVMGGTVVKNGVTLTVGVFDKDGKALMPATCTETLLTYVWNNVQTGAYSSEGFEMTVPSRTLQHAEDTNIYRILDFWGEEGYNLTFTWDKTTNKCEISGVNISGVEDFAVIDGLTLYTLLGYDVTWDDVVAEEGVPQPYFDPETNTFHLTTYYWATSTGSIYGAFADTFVLDGPISEAKWVAVGTGSYSSPLFTDENDNPYVAPGIVLENKENSNSYRLVDWLESGAEEIYLPFTVDAATNAIDVKGLVDTGLPSTIFGSGLSTNAYICDVLTLYNSVMGKSVTWDDLKAQYGDGIQSAYDPTTNTYTLVVSYVFPKDGVIINNAFFRETYVLDQSASPASVAVRKISSEPIAIKSLVGGSFKTTREIKSTSTRQLTLSAKSNIRSMKTATPVARKTRVANLEKLQ